MFPALLLIFVSCRWRKASSVLLINTATLILPQFTTTGHHEIRSCNTAPCVVPTSTHLSRKCDRFVTVTTTAVSTSLRDAPTTGGVWTELNMHRHISPLRSNNETLCPHTLASPSEWPDKQICNGQKCFLVFRCRRHKKTWVQFIIDPLLTTPCSLVLAFFPSIKNIKRHQSFTRREQPQCGGWPTDEQIVWLCSHKTHKRFPLKLRLKTEVFKLLILFGKHSKIFLFILFFWLTNRWTETVSAL